MEQLIKVTSAPLQMIRFTQNGRLVPTDHMDLERQKAMARYTAFSSRFSSGSGSTDLAYLNKLNDAFSSSPPPVPGSYPASAESSTPVNTVRTAPPPSKPKETSSSPPVLENQQTIYTMQRASLELRAAKGDLSFVPPLVMTIITQYPDVHFEYTGDFHYVPPRDHTENSNINLSI